jgi:hypothetical protein
MGQVNSVDLFPIQAIVNHAVELDVVENILPWVSTNEILKQV